jgi:hypothetical protein
MTAYASVNYDAARKYKTSTKDFRLGGIEYLDHLDPTAGSQMLSENPTALISQRKVVRLPNKCPRNKIAAFS